MDYTGLSKLTYGLYVLTASDDGKDNGMIVSVAAQVASEPAVIAVSVTKANYSNEMIANSKKFNLSVLTIDTKVDFIGSFGFHSLRDTDKLNNVTSVKGKNGVPVVTENCSSYMECEVVGEYDCGDNVVYFGKVTNAVVLGPSEPMTLEHYQKVLNGTVSQKSPAYTARYVK